MPHFSRPCNTHAKVGAANKVAARAGRAALKTGLVAGASAAAAIVIESRRRKKREG